MLYSSGVHPGRSNRLIPSPSVIHVFLSPSCFDRTKALVLELLAAVCLVRGGHEIILSAFDNFKEVGCIVLISVHKRLTSLNRAIPVFIGPRTKGAEVADFPETLLRGKR